MKKILVLIALVILIAGCTGREVKVDANDGIKITDFTATPLTVNSGETVLFDYTIENQGGTTAKNVRVDLYGVQGTWRHAITGAYLQDTQPRTFGTLNPPVPSENRPGGLRINQVELKTPPIPQGVTQPLTIEARASYNYNTSGYMIIKALSESELRRENILKEQVADPVTIKNSEGPLKMGIPSRFKYAIIVDPSIEDDIYPFRIQIENIGSGYPITDAINGKLTGTIQLLGPGVQFYDCLGVTSGNVINLNDANVLVRLREVQRGVADIACNLKIDHTVWQDRPVDQITLVFNLFYRYYARSTATVTVTGR